MAPSLPRAPMRPPLPMRSALVRRYLVFLGVITLLVLAGEQVFQWVFLNTSGRAEAERALSLHPELARHIGPHRFGVAWRGQDQWWMPGPARALIYMPISGERSSGVIYLRERGTEGNWTLERLSFRESGTIIWTTYFATPTVAAKR